MFGGYVMKIIECLTQGLPLPLVYCEENGKILLSNEAWRKLLITRTPHHKKILFPELMSCLSETTEKNEQACCYNVELEKQSFVAHFIKLSDSRFLILLLLQIAKLELPEIENEITHLRERILQLETFLEASFDGFWICDKKGKVVQVNKAAERLNSLEGVTVVGRNVTDLVKEGYYDQSVTLKVLKSKKTETVMVKPPNGKKLLATGTPMFDALGEIRYVIVNVRDITVLEELREKLEETEALSKRFRTEVSKLYTMKDLKKKIIYCSPQMESVISYASRAATTDATILLTGESGVGKGLLSELIHLFSDRRFGPFFSINCAMLPPDLIESELFGYVAGAFTGALSQGKPGLVEMADRGTLLLDEIGDLPISLQAKLLEFLETRSFTHVGGVKKENVDVRIICATNKELEQEVSNKKFRADLYFRLNAVPIDIPPLRSRTEDIPILISHFLKFYNQKHSKRISLTANAINYLFKFDYLGNVRELKHLIERVVVLAEKDQVDVPELDALNLGTQSSSTDYFKIPTGVSFETAKEIFEKELIQKTLKNAGNQKSAARLLNVNQSTISRKMKKYSLNTDQPIALL